MGDWLTRPAVTVAGGAGGFGVGDGCVGGFSSPHALAASRTTARHANHRHRPAASRIVVLIDRVNVATDPSRT
jgi:hypothetical protein